ncbi:CHAT domain-containing protein [Frankia sp. Cas4]|uniref:CHAT domain-containing protein n=1 Tax=Frankia sp. Cas4 TaxID=3073927 RepID=UPI002AD5A945|nr:CHAT domain-containing protein [Frankia sp. Cas4]
MSATLPRKIHRHLEVANASGTLLKSIFLDSRRTRRLAKNGKFEEAYELAKQVAKDVEQSAVRLVRGDSNPEALENKTEWDTAMLAFAGIMTGEILLYLGKYGEALAALDAPYKAFSLMSPEDLEGGERGALRMYAAAAAGHRALGDYGEARRMAIAGLDLYESGRARATALVPARLRAVYTGVLSWDGDLAQHFLECIELALLNGDPDGAEVLLDRLGDLRAGGRQKFDSQAQRLQAWIARERGDLESAARILAEIVRTHGAATQVLAVMDLALVWHRMGHLEDARALYEGLLTEGTLPYDRGHPMRAEAVTALADIIGQLGDWESAARILEEITLENGALYDVVSVVSTPQRIQYLARQRESLHRLISLLMTPETFDQKWARKAYVAVLRSKALDFEADLAQRRALSKAENAELKPKFEQLRDLRAAIGQKTLSGAGAEGAAEHARLIEAWRREALELESEITRAIPKDHLSQASLETLDEICALIPSNIAVIEYFRCEGTAGAPARYMAFVLAKSDDTSPEKRSVAVPLGDADTIDERIIAFGKFISRKTAPVEQSTSLLFEQTGDLYQALIEPLLPLLSGTEHLVIAPDGLLSEIPFEVFCEAPRVLLWNTFNISYVPTGRDLLKILSSPATAYHPSPPVVVGDPDFDLVQASANGGGPSPAPYVHGRSWPSVAKTRTQAIRIAGLLGVEPLLGGAARKKEILELERPQVLHIASHGARFPSASAGDGTATADYSYSHLWASGQSCGLVLAGANFGAAPREPAPGTGDGWLSANDVHGMDLVATDLITLSACRTGLGQAIPGEISIGLPRSFLVAGARSVVVSLWPVPPEAAEVLMITFYTELLNGVTKLAALRAGQEAVREHATKPYFRRPYFWAAFVLVGDYEAMAWTAKSP